VLSTADVGQWIAGLGELLGGRQVSQEDLADQLINLAMKQKQTEK
jgi:hypothetical protein